jgi:hypothetical protein
MHRRSSSRHVPANAPRWCKGANDTAYATLPALGVLALPERAAVVTRPIGDALPVAPRVEALRPLHHPPDSPPPRV